MLQSASNYYITKLGDPESAATRISILGICNGISGVKAALLLVAVILSDAGAMDKSIHVLNGAENKSALNLLASRIILPYAIIMVILIFLVCA